MRKGMGGVLALATVLGLVVVPGPALGMPVAATAPDAGATSNDETFLPACLTPEAMECIEAVDYVVDGQWVSAPGPFIVKTIESSDGQGDDTVYGPDKVYFDTPGLTHVEDAGQVAPNVIISPGINGPEFPAYKVLLQPISVRDGVYSDVPPDGLQRTQYRLSFRTAQLQPMFSKVGMVDAETSVEPIEGGLRVSVAGEPGPSQFVADYDEADRTDTFSGLTYEWGGFISDARFADPGGRCVGKGIIAAYSNGHGGWPPEWNRQTGSLSFGTGGYHYWPNGKVYKGRAEVTVPGPLAECLWGVDPRRTARVEIEVFSDEGEEVAGTKTVNYDAEEDVVRIIAIDFTYSKKDIVARPTPLLAKAGKKSCTADKTLCVTIDRKRQSAKVTVSEIKGANEMFAAQVAGAREIGKARSAAVKKGTASFTLGLNGAGSRGQVWILRTASTFVSSFQVG